jgi:hypothetical protein
MVTKRNDPGFITYYGPYAATADSGTARFELPIPIEDSLAGLETPGCEEEMDELTRGMAHLFQRWSGRAWDQMTKLLDIGINTKPVRLYVDNDQRIYYYEISTIPQYFNRDGKLYGSPSALMERWSRSEEGMMSF